MRHPYEKVKKINLSQWVVTKFYRYPSMANTEFGEYDPVWHDKPWGDPYIKTLWDHFFQIAQYYHDLEALGTGRVTCSIYENKNTIEIRNVFTGEKRYISSKDGRYQFGTSYQSEWDTHFEIGMK